MFCGLIHSIFICVQILQKLGIPLNRRRLEHKDLKESLKNLCGMFSFISESSALLPTPNNEQATETEQGSQLDRSNSYQLGADILYHHVVEANDKFNSMLDNLTNDDDDDSNIIVLAIVGAGGIGKTTQARKLFDNPRARSAFDTTIWLSLSTDFTDTDLLSAIISAGGGNPRGLETRADFETMLSRIIKKKRCLIMLDNVVSGHIYEDFLEGPLNCAARGSRILITTRDKNVAAKMKAVHIYEVQELSCEDGWKLLYNRASLKENEIIDLKEIGQKIAERCNGIPLAINTIGSVLRTKRKTEFEWLSVHANSAWSFKDLPEGTQGVMGSIFLSYCNLSSHLKQCFLYCSLFPENIVINRHFVTQLWISEGLVEPGMDNNIEEVAKKYYDELVLRNLLQLEPGSDDTTQCIMHSRVRSFVQFLTKDEIVSGNLELMNVPAVGIRRLSIMNKGLTAIPKDIERLTKLRTLLLFKNPLSSQGLDDIFKKLKFLRVLDLAETLIENVPKSIGKLLHLRHLNLSFTRIKELPKSMACIGNLRFLGLQSCIGLRSLPECIQELQHIRVLDLRGTVLNQVPPGLSNLIHLSILHGFVVNNETTCEKNRDAWPLKDLNPLEKLNSLEILKIERAKDGSEAQKAALGSKNSLRNLELCCSNESRHVEVIDDVEATRIQSIFEDLSPPQSLHSLKIVAYLGNRYPSWISALRLPNLQRLILVDCIFCRNISQLYQIPQLKFLSIVNSSALKQIAQVNYSQLEQIDEPNDSALEQIDQANDSDPPAFPKLEELHIKDLRNLESWTGFKTGDLPRLRKFSLENCHNLKSLPDGLEHSKALTSMRVIHADRIKAVENLPVLKELVLQSNKSLHAIHKLPLLQELTIISCPNLLDVYSVTSLCHLNLIDRDRELVGLPKWLEQHATRLDTLNIVAQPELLKKCLPEGQDWPVIANIGHVYARLQDRSPYFSYEKRTGKAHSSHPSATSVAAAHGAGVVRVRSMQVLKVQLRQHLFPLLLALGFVLSAYGTSYLLPTKVSHAFRSLMALLVFLVSIYRLLIFRGLANGN